MCCNNARYVCMFIVVHVVVVHVVTVHVVTVTVHVVVLQVMQVPMQGGRIMGPHIQNSLAEQNCVQQMGHPQAPMYSKYHPV